MYFPEDNEEEDRGTSKGRPAAPTRTSYCSFSSGFFVFLFAVMYTVLSVKNASFQSPVSLQSRCRIVSSSVDLRTSKVCELGVLNYNAKNVFYPLEQKKYRCYSDYYWASIFKVEYIDHLGQIKYAFAEAPNEDLPYNCRPSFSSAWLTKDEFKVNETYECWYTMGTPKVFINHEGLFNCRDDPSALEMIKRSYVLFMRILKSTFDQRGLEIFAGVKEDFLTPLLTIILLAVVRLFGSRSLARYMSTVSLKRACFFTVYFSFMSWITFQYLKRLGLSLSLA